MPQLVASTPEPVSEQSAEQAAAEADDDRPRRTGWWARRLMGKG